MSAWSPGQLGTEPLTGGSPPPAAADPDTKEAIKMTMLGIILVLAAIAVGFSIASWSRDQTEIDKLKRLEKWVAKIEEDVNAPCIVPRVPIDFQFSAFPSPIECGPSAEEFLTYNRDVYVPSFPPEEGQLSIFPAKKTLLVTCMDARVNPKDIFGYENGAIHVVRNAGGVSTDDAIRSIAISQYILATEEIIIMHHYACGMTTFVDDVFSNFLLNVTGQRPEFKLEAFPVAESDVIQSVRRVLNNVFVRVKNQICGCVYCDVDFPNPLAAPPTFGGAGTTPPCNIGGMNLTAGEIACLDIADMIPTVPVGPPSPKELAEKASGEIPLRDATYIQNSWYKVGPKGEKLYQADYPEVSKLAR